MIPIRELINENSQFSILFPSLFDYVHFEQLAETLIEVISPDSYEKKGNHYWHSSDINYCIIKGGIQLIVSKDLYDVISLTLASENNEATIQVVKSWVASAIELIDKRGLK